MARADTWYKVAGCLEAYAEVHEAFLLELGEYVGEIERLAQRLSDISDREVAPANGVDSRYDFSVQMWSTCKRQIAMELARHRLALIQAVQQAALATDDSRRLGNTVIRP